MHPTMYKLWNKELKRWDTSYHHHLSPNGQIYYDAMNVTDRYDVCFYTGRKDKDGKEIYDGAVVSNGIDEYYGVVEWIQDECQFLVNFGDGIDLQEIGEWCVVCGNRYENPELLEVG